MKKFMRKWGQLSCVALLATLVAGQGTGTARAGDYLYTAASFDKASSSSERNYSWQNKLNWEPEGIPGAGDGATIPADKVAFLATDVTIARLSVAGGLGGSETPPKLNVTQTFNWSGGHLDNNIGSLTIGSGAQWNISGDGRKTTNIPSIVNLGTATWSGKGNISLLGSVLDNSGTFIMTGDAYFGVVAASGFPTFNNTGTLIKRNSTGVSSFGGFDPTTTDSFRCVFNNSGLTKAESGNLVFGSGLSTGDFNALSGARLVVNDAHTLQNVSIIGAGTFEFSGGSVLSGNIASSARMELTGGILSGDGPDTGTGSPTGGSAILKGGGRLVQTGGKLAGAVTIAPDFTLEFGGTGGQKQCSAVLLNKGNMVWTGGDIVADSATITNAAGGIFRVQSDARILATDFRSPFNFSNVGALIKENSTGTSYFGDRLNGFLNSGSVEVRSGTLGVDSTFLQSAGSTVLKGGNVLVNGLTAITGGTVAGSGTMTSTNGFQNSGTISPGTATTAGILNVVGNYTQNASGVLKVKMGGVSASVPQFDQLKISGNAALDGTLTTALINGFVPTSSNKFPVVTYGSQSGAFATVNSTSTKKFDTVYNANDLTLQLAPPPTLSIDAPSVIEGNSSSTSKLLLFTLSLSYASGEPASVNFATTDSTATAGKDYTATSGTLTFAPGKTTQTIKIPVLGDTLDESDEELKLTLSSPVGTTLANTQSIGTITDDDATPTLKISDVTLPEGNTSTTNAAFTISLSAASGQTVKVNYLTAKGGSPGAGAGVDYTAIPATTLTFAPGQTSQTVNVPIRGDIADEPDEQFLVKLGGAINAKIADSSGLCTIVDDDGIPSISVADVTVRENNSNTISMSFVVKLSNVSGRPITVKFQTAPGAVNPATDGLDYFGYAPATLTIPAGQISKMVTVSVKGDKLSEENETLRLLLSTPTFATLSDAEALGTILDNDPPPSFSVKDVSVTEGDAGANTAMVFTVELSQVSGRTITVKYKTAKAELLPAAPEADFTSTSGTLTFTPGQLRQTVSVNIIGDSLSEENEKLIFSLGNPVNATLEDAVAEGTIVDTDALPSASINDVSLSEGNSASKNAVFTVTLTQVSGRTITIKYATVGGTALADSDYTTTSGTLNFAPGQKTASIVVPVRGDTLVESDETFSVALSDAVNATLADATGSALIQNDDSAPAAIAAPKPPSGGAA